MHCPPVSCATPGDAVGLRPMKTRRRFANACLAGLLFSTIACGTGARSAAPGYITTAHPVTILTANDGEWFGTSSNPQPPRADSITVFRLGPARPPRSTTADATPVAEA